MFRQVRRLTVEAKDSGKPRLSSVGVLTVVVNGSNFHPQLTTSLYDNKQVCCESHFSVQFYTRCRVSSGFAQSRNQIYVVKNIDFVSTEA